MTRFLFRILLYIMKTLHRFPPDVRIIWGTMKDVRKEFDAVIIISAIIFIFITVLFSLFLLLLL